MQPMSCSGRFVSPFVKVLARYPVLEGKLERLNSRPYDRRVDLEQAHEQVLGWVALTGDPDLGLRAGQVTCIGGGGPLDYALHSAQSLRESVSVAHRYGRLYSDALDVNVSIKDDSATLQLESKLPWPRPIADFAMCTWYRNHLRPHLDPAADIECSFSYAQPDSVALHQKIFGKAKLTFGASFDGFSFEIRRLDRSLASSDPLLHAVHCEHLEALYTSLPEPLTISLRVRQLIAAELRHGRPSSVSVARKLHMSRRTLVRRLEAEGTSFTDQLEELRRQLALRFVSMRTLPLGEITALLGFSHVQGFHRAFKRWTGKTPLRYRETADTDAEATLG
jgi:AraC-like DNA-binding protein